MSNQSGECRFSARTHQAQTLNGDVQAAEEPLILSVDTATEVRSVAVHRGARQLALREGDGRNTHSANVLSEIDEALARGGVELKEIGLFAAAAGPGSFTGLRAGLATLKAFASTLGRPVSGIPTLHGVARAAGPAERVLAAIPAGRGEVFAQLLRVTTEGDVRELGAPSHIAPEAMLELALGEDGPVKFAGSGAHLHAELLRERALREGISFGEESAGKRAGEKFVKEESLWTLAPRVSVLAEHFAALALSRFRAGLAVGANELRAIYVRPSDAEIKEQCRAQNPPLK